MRLIDVPVTKLGRFILIEAEMHAQRNFIVLQDIGEVEIGGRVVNRIAAENDKQIHFPRIDVGGQVFDRISLVDRVRVDWVGIENGLADIAEA